MKKRPGIERLIVVAIAFAAAATIFAACSTAPFPAPAASPAAAPTPAGVRTVKGRTFGPTDHVEFDFNGGTISVSPDFKTPTGWYIRYDDGSSAQPTWPRDARCTSPNACGTVTVWSGTFTPNVKISTLDGRPWLDSEVWSEETGESYPVGPKFLGMTRGRTVVKYQGCKDGRIYSSASLPSLMSVLEGEKSADQTTQPGSDQKSDSAVIVTGDASSTRLPVCNWRHRIGLDMVFPPPKWVATTRLVAASEQTPLHIEFTNEQAVTVDLFANDTPLDRVTIKLPNGYAVTYKPRYGTPNCPNLAECKEASIASGDTTLIQESLDGPLNNSKLWKTYNPLGGAPTYTACEGGALFTGKDRAGVEAALALVEKKTPPQQDMVIDPRTGIAAPPDVIAHATPVCDWAKRAAEYQKMIDAAKKEAKDRADSAASQP